MTREHKLALVVGFGLILFVGILVSDHLRRDPGEAATSLPAASASTLFSMPQTLAAARPTQLFDPRKNDRTPAPSPAVIPATPSSLPEVLTFAPATAPPPVHPPSAETVSVLPRLPRTPTIDVHIIKPGDTLQSVSLSHFGTTKRWQEIASLNSITNADRIREGQRIRLPGDATSRPEPADAVIPRTYTVAKGDTLSEIARVTLGSAKRWREIQKLNDIDDPSGIAIGDVLNVPQS